MQGLSGITTTQTLASVWGTHQPSWTNLSATQRYDCLAASLKPFPIPQKRIVSRQPSPGCDTQDAFNDNAHVKRKPIYRRKNCHVHPLKCEVRLYVGQQWTSRMTFHHCIALWHGRVTLSPIIIIHITHRNAHRPNITRGWNTGTKFLRDKVANAPKTLSDRHPETSVTTSIRWQIECRARLHLFNWHQSSQGSFIPNTAWLVSSLMAQTKAIS